MLCFTNIDSIQHQAQFICLLLHCSLHLICYTTDLLHIIPHSLITYPAFNIYYPISYQHIYYLSDKVITYYHFIYLYINWPQILFQRLSYMICLYLSTFLFNIIINTFHNHVGSFTLQNTYY